MVRDLVNNVTIASPCSMEWNSMSGDEKVRFCTLCEQSVFDISQMTRSEANKLLRSKSAGGNVCVRIFRRADGTVLTRDCPIGLRKVRDDVRKLRARVCSGVAVILSLLAIKPMFDSHSSSAASAQAQTTATAEVDPLAVAKRNSAKMHSHDAFAECTPECSQANVSQYTGGSAPAMKCEMQGTVGPQGADATVIEGIGSAGTVRVNNLANLEALLNILANAGEILGIAIGTTFLGRSLKKLKDDTPDFRKWMAIAGTLYIVAGVALPWLINYMVNLMRDLNLFS